MEDNVAVCHGNMATLPIEDVINVVKSNRSLFTRCIFSNRFCASVLGMTMLVPRIFGPYSSQPGYNGDRRTL